MKETEESSVKEPPLPKQPAKCKGCYWGEWRETKQLCHLPKCVLEKNNLRKIKTQQL
ncbi:hypothetical protein I6N90_02655 [Paenibacillus sp. GSMTC-2017]|uniref:hypothetical protein n=1 Tax=Paenibacillus sp. GSMTC-2017 TaxID=2794350 RepID=UPI0018D8788E|nr:hypothetical protein [Paenibacillus sp. GSMTC-2017]MBH5316709.1 hypothetical protein [Paenibacillus sp. GSMTC-2017]